LNSITPEFDHFDIEATGSVGQQSAAWVSPQRTHRGAHFDPDCRGNQEFFFGLEFGAERLDML
jgi:hypothetical protein